jgi:hypothetical protein
MSQLLFKVNLCLSVSNIKIRIGHPSLFLENNNLVGANVSQKYFNFSHLRLYILEIHHSQQDFDSMIPKESPSLIPKSQIYNLEMEITSHETIL